MARVINHLIDKKTIALGLLRCGEFFYEYDPAVNQYALYMVVEDVESQVRCMRWHQESPGILVLRSRNLEVLPTKVELHVVEYGRDSEPVSYV